MAATEGRVGPRAHSITYRDFEEMNQQLVDKAASVGESKTDLMRRITRFGLLHMPDNFQPTTERPKTARKLPEPPKTKRSRAKAKT